MKAKDTTDTPATESQETKRLRREVLKLTHNLEEERKKRDRRDKLFNGGFLIFLAILTIVGIITGNWLGVIFNLSTATWVFLNWMKDKQINFQRYLIDFQFGLHDLQMKELEAITKETK